MLSSDRAHLARYFLESLLLLQGVGIWIGSYGTNLLLLSAGFGTSIEH
jgi:hypothetical protein